MTKKTSKSGDNEFKTQKNFWLKLQQFKFDLIYYNLHFSHCIAVMRGIKYISAGLTTVTTGIWIQWNDVKAISTICAIVIFLLQAFSTLSELLPFDKRRDELREMVNELEPLYIKMENDWRKIANGEMTESKIFRLSNNYDYKQAAIEKHYLKTDSLTPREYIRKKADDRTEEYFKNFI